MKIVTFNVNSLKARETFVGLYLDHAEPDVLCLQELKLDTGEVPLGPFESRGYHVAIHAQPQWNGVLIASRTPLEDIHRGLPDADEGQARLVAATTAGIRVVNLYCPQGQSTDSPKFSYKLRFYDALIGWLEETQDLSAPTAVVGDLNIAPRPEDVWDPAAFADVPSFHPAEHERWARLIELGLSDAVVGHIEPNTYSFWDYRAGRFHKRQGMRIDHILVTQPLAQRVTDAFIEREWRKKKIDPATADDKKPLKLTPSDHAPVGIVVD